MELKTLVRDMVALEEGRWVDGKEVPSLGDLRIKMRGSHTEFVRKAIAERERAGADRGEAFEDIVGNHCFLDIEGLTNGGKPVTVDELRPLLKDDALEPLRLMLLDVIRAVDATREAKEIALAKN